MYYEIIYENGEHSVAFYDSDEEAKSAIKAHVERAMSGVPATPASTPRTDVTDYIPNATWAAQRVVKVLKYDEHPQDYGVKASNLTKEVASKTLEGCIKEVADTNGVVNVQELAAALLETTAPRVNSGPHESNYKAEEVGVLKWQQ